MEEGGKQKIKQHIDGHLLQNFFLAAYCTGLRKGECHSSGG